MQPGNYTFDVCSHGSCSYLTRKYIAHGYSTWYVRRLGRLTNFCISNYICQITNTINYIFLFAFWICYFLVVTIPLLSSWWNIYKPRKFYIYVVSPMFVLLFSGFDTFHAQGKMRLVCGTFAVLTLPCYLILNKMMLDLTGKGMFRRGVNHGWHCFWSINYLLLWCCLNGAVLCKVALQELTLFYKQLGLGTSPKIWFSIQDF